MYDERMLEEERTRIFDRFVKIGGGFMIGTFIVLVLMAIFLV